MIETYGHIAVANEITDENADVIRIEESSDAANEIHLQREGFFFADRTVKATISLSKIAFDLDRFIRLPIIETNTYKTDILRIAEASFNYDRRFHIFPDCSTDISRLVLKQWIDKLEQVFVALFREEAIGFMALKETETGTLFVHLAAVEEKYRLTGAAMGLYANAVKISKKRGYKKLEGRISTQNTAVMNIYVAFGASFSDPHDIFIKERNV